MNDHIDSAPWYKQGYPWMLIAIPASAVIVGIATFFIAVVTYDGLVVDDYYRRGLEINRRLERERRAVELAIGMQSRLVGDRLTVSLRARTGYQLPDRVKVHLAHATRAGLDRDMLLERIDHTNYALDIEPLPEGYWYLQVDGPDWRIVERTRLGSL